MTDALAEAGKHVPDIASYLQHASYAGIFLWFITVDQITPIPEEFTLIIIGYLAASGLLSPIIAGVMALMGFVVADTVYFFLARHGNKFIQKRVAKPIPLIARYRKKLEENLPKAMLVLCFIPRMRFFAPIFVGAGKTKYAKFLVIDASILAMFTAVYVGLGYFFSKSLGLSLSKVKSVENIVFLSTLVIATAVVIIIEVRRKRKKE